MSAAEPDATLMQAMGRIDALLARVDQISDPATRENVTGIIQSLLELHGQALERLLALLTQRGDQGRSVLDALEADQLVSSVLLVHNLHPRSIEQRVQRALQQVQPYLAAHNGRVELLEITAQRVVRLRLAGDCRGCPGSQATLTNLINEAVFMSAPDAVAIEVDGIVDPQSAAAASSARQTQLGTTPSRDCGAESPTGPERRS